MPRSRLDEKLIRAAARVTDWHASHHGALADELPDPPQDLATAAPAPRRSAEARRAEAAPTPPNPAAVPRA